ncbi:hypothetical protein JZ751_008539 [Albula glossodonta]|uniref:FHA domain-containing protein n=1 Tax=Albula glossodonta TaxID=121402 RepID=A0A8T2N448_9TELE|nr:hypothetical protein JZ751_008539 [Albula glossodonta]
MSLTSWFLVSSGGTRHRLPREMIFVGRDDCELMLQSRSVDKQHAVINYEAASDEHKVKDLGSLNGTFVNDVRIQEQMYITLKMDDKLRFGYDILSTRRNPFFLSDTLSSANIAVSLIAFSLDQGCYGAAMVRLALNCVSSDACSNPRSLQGDEAALILLSERLHPGEGGNTGFGWELKEARFALREERSLLKLLLVSHTNLFTVVRGELHVPEEALKHEKFSSQLQLSKKLSNSESSKSPKTAKSPSAKPAKSAESKDTEAASEGTSKPTDAHKGEEKMADSKELKKVKEDSLCSLGPEPSYFEIPTKESQRGDSSIHEIPTKDTEGVATIATATVAGSASAAAPGHASFTIEFDSTSPGKVTIRDHVTKNTAEPRPRPRKPPQLAGELSTLQAAIMASETKVADWLAQNDPPLPRMESTEDDSKSIKSDVPVHLKRLKGSKHEDGTQSDSENGAGLRLSGKKAGLLQGRGRAGQGGTSRTAFMIEFYDEDNPRKRRSYSFSQTAPLLGEGPSPTAPPTARRVGVASSLAAVAPTAARLLLQQRTQDAPGAAHDPKPTSSPAHNHKPNPRTTEKEQEDDQSDKGTYTIELDHPNPEEEEARRSIDKILPEDLVAVGNPRWVSQWASLAANHTRADPEGSGAEPPASSQEKEADASESGISMKSATSANSASSHTERKRRTLPQLPTEDPRGPEGQRGRLGKAPGGPTGAEIGEKQDTEPQEKESQSELRDHRGARTTTTSHRAGGVATGNTGATKPPSRPGSGGEKEGRRKRGGDGEEKGGGKPLVRQGSFTIERPSGSVPQELIPRISKGPSPLTRQRSDSAGSLDTATLLKDTEAVMAFLEAKLRDESKLDPPTQAPPTRTAGSISPESDIDTASTVSQAAAEAERRAGQKRRTLSASHKEKSSAPSVSAASRERLERKPKPRSSTESRPQRTRQPSIDLTDDDLTSSLPHSVFSDAPSSDQESRSSKTAKPAKTPAAPSTAAGKPGAMPRPRPTRASLLRRARLGEASDTELADADRASVASEVSTTSSTSRPPSGRKASRIDLLAQPRRNRLGSISARSDSEATPSRSAGPSHARVSTETLLRLGLRGQSGADTKPAPPTNRWRRLPPEYVSTSEDEFGSNRNSPKHARLRPGTTLRGARLTGSAPATPGTTGADLAKDLAILAREIHDVAGEIDSVSSSGTAPSTTLVDRVFDESLNFRKIPPTVLPKAPEINGRPAVLDSLLLTSVSQLSAKIRHSVDKTAAKIRILFKDKDRNWEEIESKLRAESDMPLLKTSNKEISSILLELKRVEKQLQVINVMVDPDGTLDALTSLGLTSPSLPKPQPTPAPPPAPTPARDTQHDLGLKLTRLHPNGEESSTAHK